MPNGGSDCCGTCWFNSKNQGKAGYAHANDPGHVLCTIRNLPIEAPFYTYCVNHPDSSPERDPIPIGPVFRGDSSGAREFWTPSPDTEEVRQHLLALVRQILPNDKTHPENPIAIYSGDVVIRQLGEFREQRAIEDLTRIASTEPTTGESGAMDRTKQGLVELAKQAINMIRGQHS